MEELKKIYPAIATKIKFQLSPKPSKAQKKYDLVKQADNFDNEFVRF